MEPHPLLRALSDTNILTVLLFGEARGEPVEGQIAVANVVKNRVAMGRWGTTVSSVALAPAQFSCLFPYDPTAFAAVLDFANRCANLTNYSPIEQQLRYVAAGVLTGALLDNTKQASHYYASTIAAPAWTHGAVETVTLGHHHFFSHVK